GTTANAAINVNPTTGQVTITPAAGFTGTINLLAGVRASSATDTALNYDTEAFTLTVVALNTVSNQSTDVGASATFTLAPNPSGGSVEYPVGDGGAFGAPANVTVTVDQATGHVTLKGAPGFVGTVNLLAGVRAADSADVQSNYATRAFTLNIAAPSLGAV